MKQKYLKMVFPRYLLLWLFFFIIPYFSVYSVTQKLLNGNIQYFFIPLIFMSLLFTVIFYLNNVYLIPRYLFQKRILTYLVYSIFCVFIAFLIPPITLYFLGLSPPDESMPCFGVVRPMLTTNLLLLFLLSFLGSVGLAWHNRFKDLEKENIASQLRFLESQIHPHFLFNVLNSVYSMTLKSAPDAAMLVEKLSSMMRYSIIKRDDKPVSLSRDIAFIEDYLYLQRVRYKNLVKVKYSSMTDNPNLAIYRNLMIPFIENAFKHGVSVETESEIFIRIDCREGNLNLLVKNQIHRQSPELEYEGMGVQNTIERMRLYYVNNFELSMVEESGFFYVDLKIRL